MGERIFVLYKFKEGVTRQEYAKWLREEHYPWGRSLLSQINVRGFFVVDDYDQDAEGLEWDAIAILDIDDRDAWYREMQENTDAAYHWEKWGTYVERYKIFFTEPIRA